MLEFFVLKTVVWPIVVVQAFNPITGEAEAGRGFL